MPEIGRGQRLLDRLGPVAPVDELSLVPDELMSRHTTLRLGGPADLWARPRTLSALSALRARCHAVGLPVCQVGSGTNLLVRDGGVRGVVINLGHLNEVRCPGRESPDAAPLGPTTAFAVSAQAGCSTGRLLKATLTWELGGLEFLAGVPGTVGGGLIMNAGTYLGEFTDVTHEVTSLRLDGSAVVRSQAECGFRYRGSDLPPDEIVVAAVFDLPPRTRMAMDEDIATLRAHRRKREPTGVPNNGSTFKNPPAEHAGRLIEAAGLKGKRIGGAIVSPVHANWLVVDRSARPACTSAHMLELIAHVQEQVEQAHGVRLELEVKVVGTDRV